MKKSSHLGYKYKDEISILVSRITLLLGKEIRLSFFDIVHIDNWEDDVEEILQGFVLSRYSIPLDKALEFTKDLNTIHVNKYNYNSSESTFTICEKPEILQRWYNIMYEGNISMKMIRKFGESFSGVDPADIAEYRKQATEETTLFTV